MWRDVLNPKNGRLLFRFDPERDLIEGQHRGEKFTIDLSKFRTSVPQLLGVQVVENDAVPVGELWFVKRENSA